MADRTRNTRIATRQHMYGGTLGNPIIKNKLFNFFSVESWKVGNPQTLRKDSSNPTRTPGRLLAVAQHQRDTAESSTIPGPLPLTLRRTLTLEHRSPGTESRRERFDPVAASLLPSFWDPNNPGDNITGINNFRVGFFQTYNYYNFSDRVDYNINDNWRVFGRISRYTTEDLQNDPTPNNSQLFVPTGTLRQSWQYSGDAVWTVTPSTIVNIRGSWNKVVDAYVSEPLPEGGWSNIWPGNNWYQAFQHASPGVPLVLPES